MPHALKLGLKKDKVKNSELICISVYVDMPLYKRLTEFSRKTNRSKSGMFRYALTAYLDGVQGN